MIREIHIKPVLNGFVCSVGCQTVVFKTAVELGLAISAYYTEPEKVEANFRKNAVNKVLDIGISEPCPATSPYPRNMGETVENQKGLR